MIALPSKCSSFLSSFFSEVSNTFLFHLCSLATSVLFLFFSFEYMIVSLVFTSNSCLHLILNGIGDSKVCEKLYLTRLLKEYHGVKRNTFASAYFANSTVSGIECI